MRLYLVAGRKLSGVVVDDAALDALPIYGRAMQVNVTAACKASLNPIFLSLIEDTPKQFANSRLASYFG